MASILDDNGYNQGFKLVESTRVRMRRRADFFISEMDRSAPKDILEIGCGTGEISNWIAETSNFRVLGSDICTSFVKYANEKYVRDNLMFEVVDFTNPQQMKDRKFDYVIGNGILHHLYPTLPQSLENILSILKPGGKMIFMEPNILNPYCAVIFNLTRKLANLEPDEMAFSRRFISHKLKVSGFKNIKVNYKDFLVPGVPSVLIKPSISVGDILEKVPLMKCMAQSLFIVAEK